MFPPASRSKRTRDMKQETAFNKMVQEDLDLTIIGDAFKEGSESTVLTQIFLGGGVKKTDSPLGTGWHADVCNNFVVQITGVKKWIMVDSKYSSYIRPTMNSGKTAIVGAHISFETETMPYIPHHIFELYPGDMLYNPEWYFHSIQNAPVGPYALGLISRQCHVARNLKIAPLFTSLVIANHAIAAIFDVEARARLMGLIQGKSLMKPQEGVNVNPADEIASGYTQ